MSLLALEDTDVFVGVNGWSVESPRLEEDRFVAAKSRSPYVSLEDLADLLTIMQHVANRTVVAVLRLLDRMPVGGSQDVLLLDHRAAEFGELVHSVQLHSTLPHSERMNHAQSKAEEQAAQCFVGGIL